ncbi:hypothetical protein CRUP_002267 [Coryphaenoides rupestris]|nr:hypothetical protein CRUP_002267 [Coryphaenoides rupestris]
MALSDMALSRPHSRLGPNTTARLPLLILFTSLLADTWRTDRQTDRQAGRQAGRQTDRQTDGRKDQVSANSEVNKMSNGNLAVVFGPNLLWGRDNAMSLSAIGPINSFTRALLDLQHLGASLGPGGVACGSLCRFAARISRYANVKQRGGDGGGGGGGAAIAMTTGFGVTR